MEAVDSVKNTQQTQATTGTSDDASESSGGSVGSSFETFLRGILSPASDNTVNEEELFAALVGQRIGELKGDAAAAEFKSIFEQKKIETARPDGKLCVEDSARGALEEYLAQGKLTQEEADQIYSEAFAGAQLDSNKDALYDSFGGEGDPTRAVADMEAALISAKLQINAFLSGDAELDSRSISGGGGTAVVDPQGTVMDGPEGFLFKPVSENQGTLAVLFAKNLTGKIMDVILKDQDGNEVETGQHIPEGTAETGREKYSFTKPGGSYPPNLKVEVRMMDGTIQEFLIPDPSKRYD